MKCNLTAVVTIYKVSDYLDKCLHSIEMQKYEAFVALLVVGANDEKCIEICRRYVEKDKRFLLLLSEPKGLSDARNVGINKTNTKYITFVDGDDYLPDSAFEELMEKANDECDIIIGNYNIDTGKKILSSRTQILSGSYSNIEGLKLFLNGHDIQFTVAWGKVYKTKLFKDYGIEYPVGKLHEDNLTTYKLLALADNIVYVDAPVYYYVKRENSLSFNTNIDKENVVIRDMSVMRGYLRELDDINNEIDAYEIAARMSLMIKMAKSERKYYEEFCQCLSSIKKLHYMHNPVVRKRMKILCALVCCFPRLLYFILGLT